MKNRLIVLIQVAVWGAFLFLPYILFPRHTSFSSEQIEHFNYFPILVTNCFFIIYYYVNYYLLIPTFFIKRKYFIYVTTVLSFLLLILFVSNLFETDISERRFDMPPHNFNPPPRNFIITPNHVGIIILFLLTSLTSLGIRIMSQWKKVEEEKAKVVLLYLKAQINPHFLFNTLNTIYALALKNSDSDTANAVVRLSDMMRYVISETQHDFVYLEDDLQYINNYVELHKLRLGKNMNLKYEVEGDPNEKMIAPMILMSFIENAFKHGVTNETVFNILILIKIGAEQLELEVKNNKFRRNSKNPDNGGRGISNAIHRLELLYPSNYRLTIDENSTEYHVSLKIILL